MKRCERCNREFVGRSNRQKWCNICRPLVVKARPKRVSRNRRPPQFAFVPVERKCELDGEVFVALSANARYCERCRALIEHLKYGPGSGHRELRAEWKPVVDTGLVRCARGVDCVFAEGKLGGLIRPGDPWDLGHHDDDPRRYIGPEHRRCSRRTSSHRAKREESE